METPHELVTIMHLLPAGWKQVSLEFGSMSWAARLEYGTQAFFVVSDRGCLELYEFIQDKQVLVPTPEEYRFSIPPPVICELLVARTAS